MWRVSFVKIRMGNGIFTLIALPPSRNALFIPVKNVFVIFFSIVECSTFSSDVVLRMRVVKYNSSWGKRTTNCDIQVNSQINVSNTGNKRIIVRSRYTARCRVSKETKILLTQRKKWRFVYPFLHEVSDRNIHTELNYMWAKLRSATLRVVETAAFFQLRQNKFNRNSEIFLI